LRQYVLDDASSTPFNELRQIMRLASTVVTDSPVKPRIIPLNDDNTHVSIDGDEIHLDDFRKMVHSLIKEADTTMRIEVLLGLKMDWVKTIIAQEAIQDDLNRSDLGYCFLNDDRNQHIKSHAKDLYLHMFANKNTQKHFITGTDASGRLQYNFATLEKWMNAASKLFVDLMLILHFTSGQPARGEEYSSYLVKNTALGERTFFWSQGTVMTIQQYHKGANSQAPVRLIARFIPPSCCHLYILFLLQIKPVIS